MSSRLCQVFYNNINVLKRAKERTSHVTSAHVLWTCSSEFDADQRQGISFVRDDSFVMLAKPVVQSGERFVFYCFWCIPVIMPIAVSNIAMEIICVRL